MIHFTIKKYREIYGIEKDALAFLMASDPQHLEKVRFIFSILED